MKLKHPFILFIMTVLLMFSTIQTVVYATDEQELDVDKVEDMDVVEEEEKKDENLNEDQAESLSDEELNETSSEELDNVEKESDEKDLDNNIVDESKETIENEESEELKEIISATVSIEKQEEPDAQTEEHTDIAIQTEVSLPYQDGDSGQAIAEMKEKLVQLGFASWSNPSPNYGFNTIAVVNRFQDYYGFNEPDIVTQEMLDKMDALLTGDYSDGDSGPHVVAIKEDLVRLGFASWSNPSPNYGYNTMAVVRRFQEYYGLPVSGIAEATTRAKIAEIVNPPYRDGDSAQPISDFKEKLVQLGFASWSNPSPNYGANTIAVVNRFQDYYGLEKSAEMDAYALDVLDRAIAGDLVRYDDGDSGSHVKKLKEKLVQLGFASWSNPSPNYGYNTIAVVNRFQLYYGLPKTDRATPQTLQKIDDVLSGPYTNGDSGSHVAKLKQKLVTLGFASWSNPSPNYGYNTMAVVKRFQAAVTVK